MAFFNQETGEVTFSDGFRLSGGLAMDEVAERLNGEQQGMVRLQSHAVPGGRLIPICMVEGGAVQSISLCTANLSIPKQRAFLFAKLGLSDPCPDTMETVCVHCPFGELLIATDPNTSQSEIRIQFTAR